jgi:hypothetical protein
MELLEIITRCAIPLGALTLFAIAWPMLKSWKI